ncbi:MAG TPA: hypothetical protein VM425_02275 [Myxococcota bacterium]|nr:hypothetical protein [Myxococcota bacterium]
MRRRKTELLPLLIATGLFLPMGFGPFFVMSAPKSESLPIVRLKILEGIDRSYTGRYANDPRFDELIGALQDMRERAISATRQRTGILFENTQSFVIRLVDADRPHFGASIRTVRGQSGRVNLISLSSEQLVSGVMDIQASLAHEFIHGVMREMMGSERYYAMPRWIREGFAVWGAGQLRERCKNLVAASFLDNLDARALVCEVGRSRYPADEYLTDAMLFEYVSQNHGTNAIKSLLAELMAGHDYTSAFESATGLSWNELTLRRESFAQMYLESVIFESGLVLFQDAGRLHETGDTPGAIQLLTRLVSGPYDSLLQPNAWFWIGRWRFEQCSYALSAEAFTSVLNRFPDNLGLRQLSRLWLSECLARVDNHKPSMLADQ